MPTRVPPATDGQHISALTDSLGHNRRLAGQLMAVEEIKRRSVADTIEQILHLVWRRPDDTGRCRFGARHPAADYTVGVRDVDPMRSEIPDPGVRRSDRGGHSRNSSRLNPFMR